MTAAGTLRKMDACPRCRGLTVENRGDAERVCLRCHWRYVAAHCECESDVMGDGLSICRCWRYADGDDGLCVACRNSPSCRRQRVTA